MADRAEKYAAKLSGDNRKRLYDAQKNLMARLEKEHTEHLVKIETEVKQITQGENLLHLPYYIIFAKELYRLSTNTKSLTWINEAEILEEKWRTRGLNYLMLEKVKEFYMQMYKNWEHFKLDISLLDGDHRLA